MNEIERVEALSLLARQINEHYDQAIYSADKAREHAVEAIKQALLCGEALAAAQRHVGKRRWMKWLAKHCARISYETARRWMRLAALSQVTDIWTAESLRQAYIIAGILPEPMPSEAPPESPLSSERITHWLGSLRKRLPIDTIISWPAPEKERVKAELAPLVELYARL